MAKRGSYGNGRPKYREVFVSQAEQYLKQSQDKYEYWTKKEGPGGTTRERQIKVSLPTEEGLARYLGVTYENIRQWRKKYDDFGAVIDALLAEQKQRLIEMSLGNEYNATIAKLMLSHNHGMHEKTEIENRLYDMTKEEMEEELEQMSD